MMEQTQRMILQQSLEHFSCSTDEVPVVATRQFRVEEVVVLAVNFLRSGCPGVQILKNGAEFSPQHSEEESIQEMKRLLSELELPNERFVIQNGHQILTITRLV